MSGGKDALIADHLPFVRFIALKIASKLPASVDPEDLFQAGCIGLMDAAERFDPSRDFKFKTYAEHRIRGAIFDELRELDHIPRSIRDKIKLGKLPAHAAATLVSIENDEFTRGDRGVLAEVTTDRFAGGALAAMQNDEDRSKARRAIDGLPERDRTVISLYYFEGMNLKEIGKFFDCSESRISQIHVSALSKLRRIMDKIDLPLPPAPASVEPQVDLDLSLLSEIQRTVFELVQRHIPRGEIAAQLGISRAQVAAHLFWSRKKLGRGRQTKARVIEAEQPKTKPVTVGDCLPKLWRQPKAIENAPPLPPLRDRLIARARALDKDGKREAALEVLWIVIEEFPTAA